MQRLSFIALALSFSLACGESGTSNLDSSPSNDATGSDAKSSTDGATDGNAGCPLSFAGCTTYEDRTATGASRVITFEEFEYDPKCLRIKAGQSVTFEGKTGADTFSAHPLRQVCAPPGVAATLLKNDSSSTTFTVQLDVAGVYNYYCLDHGNTQGQVMSGAIEVVP